MIKRYSTGRNTFRAISSVMLFLCVAAFLWFVSWRLFITGEVHWRQLMLITLLASVATLPFSSMDLVIDREKGTVTRIIRWLWYPIYRSDHNLSPYDSVVAEYGESRRNHPHSPVREVTHIRLVSEKDNVKSILIDSFENDRDGALTFAEEVASYLDAPLLSEGFD